MKQTTKKLVTFFLILLTVLMLFTVVGSAAEGASGEAATAASKFSVSSVINRVKTELTEANYIGGYVQKGIDVLKSISAYFFIIFGVVALIECFFGYRLLRLELFLAGLFGGFVGGLIVYPYILKVIPGLPGYVELIVGGVFAIVGALLIHFFFKFAVLVGVGYAAFLYSQPFLEKFDNALLYRILIAVACGILAFFLIKLVFVLGTAFVGGVIALTQFFTKVSFMQKVLYQNDAIFQYTDRLGIHAVTFAVVAGAVIGLLGMIFQFANTRRRRA